MYQEFYQHCNERHYWKKSQKLLLAVSGGVDSMVLLHLMTKIATIEEIEIGVVHVDHGLRQESEQEALYLQKYCEKEQLSFYSTKWEETDKSTNIEARARTFRYHFFAEIMKKYSYSILLTAHHLDDQAETILMKLARGSAFANFVGIRARQTFHSGILVRPFLSFPKNLIEEYAKKHEIIYFEDSSNQSLVYTRNRVRHQLVPILKKENNQFLQHIEEFSEQIDMATTIIQSVIEPKYKQWVKRKNDSWELELTDLKNESHAIQTFFLTYFFQQNIIHQKLEMNKKQLQQIVKMINHKQPQIKMAIGKEWEFYKTYDVAYLKKKTTLNRHCHSIVLGVNEQTFLSENEWFGIEELNAPLVQPEEVKEWLEISICVDEQMMWPLTIRHRENGDKIQLKANMSKKVSRLFIDKKIPNDIRKKAWIICSKDEQIVWIPEFANSYLSIPKETDKILYRLIYKRKE